MASPKKSLEQWVTETFTDQQYTGNGKRCTALSLVHLVGSQDRPVEKEVYTWRFAETGGNTSTPKDYADAMLDKANSHVQDFPGIQVFNVLAFYGTTIPALRFPFKVEVAYDADGLMTENPTATGQRQQDMRQRDMTFGQMFAQQQHLNDFGLRLMSVVVSENQALRTENAALFTHAKEILLQKVLEDRGHERAMVEAKRNAAIVDKVLTMAPALANTIAGREVFPQAKADTAILEAVAENIKPEHVGMLDGMFPPELAGVLKERILQYEKKKEQEAERMERLYPPVQDPEADAAGDAQPIRQLEVMAGGKATRKAGKR